MRVAEPFLHIACPSSSSPTSSLLCTAIRASSADSECQSEDTDQRTGLWTTQHRLETGGSGEFCRPCIALGCCTMQAGSCTSRGLFDGTACRVSWALMMPATGKAFRLETLWGNLELLFATSPSRLSHHGSIFRPSCQLFARPALHRGSRSGSAFLLSGLSPDTDCDWSHVSFNFPESTLLATSRCCSSLPDEAVRCIAERTHLMQCLSRLHHVLHRVSGYPRAIDPSLSCSLAVHSNVEIGPNMARSHRTRSWVPMCCCTQSGNHIMFYPHARPRNIRNIHPEIK